MEDRGLIVPVDLVPFSDFVDLSFMGGVAESSRDVRLSIELELARLVGLLLAGVVETLRTGVCFLLIGSEAGVGAGSVTNGGDAGSMDEALLDCCDLISGVPESSSSSPLRALKELDREVRFGRARAGLGLAPSVDPEEGDLGEATL